MDPPLQRDDRPRRTTTTRRVSAVLERRVALLHRRDQHEHWVRPLLRDVAGRRGGGREEEEEGKDRVRVRRLETWICMRVSHMS
jgi:hypothetical protein